MATRILVSRVVPGVARNSLRSVRASRVAARPAGLAAPVRALSVSRPMFAERTTVDEKIEEITELYATAKDEFDIAIEETEKQTVYAEEDRAAAREELDKLNEAFQAIMDGPDQDMANEIRKRIGQRIRELDTAVARLEEMAQEHD